MYQGYRKRKDYSFYKGMVTSVVVIVFSLFAWAAHLIIKVEPAIKATNKRKIAKTYPQYERQELVQSLEKLYHLCKFFGYREYAALAMGSAGAILSVERDRTSRARARYYYLMAIDEAETAAKYPPSMFVSRLDPMDPILLAYYQYSVFLNDLGERREAYRTLHKVKKMAEDVSSKSKWLRKVDNRIHAMNMGKY